MIGRRSFNRVSLIFTLVVSSLAVCFAQTGPSRGRLEPPRDPLKETFGKHNLQVAKYYIVRRKAYEGALDRLKEIIETYPEFSKIDEVYYFAGEAAVKLGKPDDAGGYYRRLIREYPASQWVKKARERLTELKLEQE